MGAWVTGEALCFADECLFVQRLADAFKEDEKRQQRFKLAIARQKDQDDKAEELRQKARKEENEVSVAKVRDEVKVHEDGADVKITKIEGEEAKLLAESPELERLDRKMDGGKGDTLAWFRGGKGGGGHERERE